MALEKDITNAAGITMTYWRISEYSARYPDANVIVSGYVSKEYREEDKAIDHFMYSVDPDLNRAQMYDIIKTKQEFSDATDI